MMIEDVIVVEDLTKVYGNIMAVDHVSLRVPRGMVVSLLGPNGAGKTTLVKILTTLARPTSGRAFVSGWDVQKHGVQIRARIGVVPQFNNLDRYLTARENLILHAKQHDLRKGDYEKHIDELLDFMGLYDRRNDYPNEYSGGMQRRLVFARALVHRPQILFLDEPTTGLDPQSRRAVWDYLEKVRGQLTIFLTTHYMEEADRLSDRIIVIDRGRTLVEGTARDLKTLVSDQHVYELEVSAKTAEYVELLRKQDYVERCEATDSILEVQLRDDNYLTSLIHLFQPGDLGRVTRREPTLEDVFIHLTGRRIRD